MRTLAVAFLFLQPFLPWATASNLADGSSLQKRGDCDRIRDVVEALGRVPNPADLCARLAHKPHATTVFVTTTATR